MVDPKISDTSLNPQSSAQGLGIYWESGISFLEMLLLALITASMIWAFLGLMNQS